MKKERSGLRYREYLTICGVLDFPCWLVLCDIYPKWPWRAGVIFIAWSLGAAVLALLAQDRLEARGRFVTSGIDISRKDVALWSRRNVHKLYLGNALFGCLIMVHFVAGTDIAWWGKVLLPAVIAISAILAVMTKLTTK